MSGQVMVSDRLLEWAVGVASTASVRTPWWIDDVETDGSAISVITRAVESNEGRVLQGQKLPVPDENRPRALRLRHILVEIKSVPEFLEEGVLIDFSAEVGGDIGFTTKPVFYGGAATSSGRPSAKGLGAVPGKFKKRPRG